MWCAPSSDDELASVVASLRQEVASLRHLSVARLSEEVATLHEQQLTMLTKIQEIIDGTGVDVPPLRPVARPTLPVAQEVALLVPPVDDPKREENANAHAPVNEDVDEGPEDPPRPPAAVELGVEPVKNGSTEEVLDPAEFAGPSSRRASIRMNRKSQAHRLVAKEVEVTKEANE